MKKITKLVLSVALVFVCLISLASCITSATTSISIAKMPKTTFTVNEIISEDDVLVQLLVKENSNTQLVNLSYPDANGNVAVDVAGFEGRIQIKGFNLSAVGNYTAIVLYGSASSYFDYEVINPESGFAGGNGSVNNPYQITEPEQLKLIANDLDANYKLMNDLDLQGYGENLPLGVGANTDWAHVFVVGEFAGTFDGNGKKLYNITEELFIFDSTKDATVKDLDIYVNSNGFSIVVQTISDILFENVNAYGTLYLDESNNNGVYVIYGGLGDSAELKFVECYNEVNLYSTKYNGGFIGYLYAGSTAAQDTVIFENCDFAGHIEGSQVGAYLGNIVASASANLVFKNSKVSGTVVGTVVADAVAAYRSSATTDYSAGPVVSEGTLTTLKTFNFDDLAKWNENGKLVLNAVGEEVASVKVQVSTYASMVNGSSLQSVLKEYDLTNAEILTEFVKANVENKTGVADGNEVFYIGENSYIFNASNSAHASDYVSIGAVPTITIFCYNADGVLLGQANVPLA